MIVVVGRFPPPLGGVSVFVKRKYQSLVGDGAQCVDLKKAFWWAKIFVLGRQKGCVFYLNTGNILFLTACFFLGVLGKSYIYDHNASRGVWGRRFGERVYCALVRRSMGVRVVHEHLIRSYANRGLADKVEVETPFIAPIESELAGIIKTYPKDVLRFLDESAYFKLAMSASKYAVDAAGRDVYGFDALAVLLERLEARGLRYKFLLNVADFDASKFPKELFRRLERLSETGSLTFMIGQYEFWPVLKNIDCFLRLTTTDGDSVSVREALYFKCAVVASDVVPRPDGVALYSFGSDEELERRVSDLISGAGDLGD